MRRILFVDDNPAVLSQIESLLADRGDDWSVAFAADGEKAWQMLGKTSFDAVVSDWEMPGMSGAELLFRVMHRHPQTVRIALSEKVERDLLIRSLGPAHQHLFKPCDPEELAEVLSRAMILRDLLKNERLQRLVSNVLSLPSIPELYLELLEELRKENPSVQRAAEIISRDIGMCSKLLQFVNSAFIGLSRELTDPVEAVLFLGVETVKAMVLSLQIFSLYDQASVQGFSFSELWEHSWRTALLARQISESEGQERSQADMAFVAGLLHDVGKVILVTGATSQYEAVMALRQDGALSTHEAESAIFHCTHAEVGGYLLGLWGVPSTIVQAVAFHHHPNAAGVTAFAPLMAVHAANVIDHERNEGVPGDLDSSFLASTGCAERALSWREQFSKDSQKTKQRKTMRGTRVCNPQRLGSE